MTPRAIFRLAFAALIFATTQAGAQDREIEKRRAAERRIFTDAQIFDGFFKIAFGAEMRFAKSADRIRKYHVPVRVHIDNRATPDRGAQIEGVIADIKSRVAHLDISVTNDKGAANVALRLLRERDLPGALREMYGSKRAASIERALAPQCLSAFRKDARFHIVHSDIFLVADIGDFEFRDCLYEEILQSLGPINDTASVPWTMFNDNVRLGFFGVYDQYLLNILYHPRVRAGMTRREVRALLPEIMPEVRAFVAKMNSLPP